MTKYNEYRAKARKWDELVAFFENDYSIVDTIPITSNTLLRMSKKLDHLKREKVKKLVHLDILGESL